MLDKFKKRMREDPEFNDDVNVALNMAGVGLAVASIALALNKKSNANTQIQNRDPVKFRKERGRDHWGYGSLKSKPRYWFSADKVGENRYRVEWTIDIGSRENRGSYESTSIKEAEAMAERILDDYVPVFNIPEAVVGPRSWDSIQIDNDGWPACINCGGAACFKIRFGVWKCPDCGCVFDNFDREILWDEWDHEIFDAYREKTERLRESTYAGGRRSYVSTGYSTKVEVTPEAFDSVYYSQIMDYSNPKDRSRILSFNRGKPKSNSKAENVSGRKAGNSTLDSYVAGDWRFDVHSGRKDNRVRIINRGRIVDDREVFELALLAMNMYELSEPMYLDFDYEPVLWSELMGLYLFLRPYSKERIRDIIPVSKVPKARTAAGTTKISEEAQTMDRTITRRNGKSVRIPVDDDGYVPVKALIERQEMRRPHAQLMDSFQTAKVVRPMKMTPEQAAPWFISPGRSDIQGIDAPADAIVTMRSDADGHLKCGSRRQKAVKTNGNGSRNEENLRQEAGKRSSKRQP